SGTAALLQDADEQLVQVGGAGVVVQKPDVNRGRPGEIASRDVWRIAQLFDRSLNALAHMFLYVGVAAQCTGDGHRRDASMLRDFVHRYSIATPSGRSFHY